MEQLKLFISLGLNVLKNFSLLYKLFVSFKTRKIQNISVAPKIKITFWFQRLRCKYITL